MVLAFLRNASALLALPVCVPFALADTRVEIPAVDQVMAGSSSTGSDQVWVTVQGQLPGVPAECVYGDHTLFYLPANNSFMSTDKALALLLSAKTMRSPVSMVYSLEAQADFYWFGITRCVINRLGL